MIKDINAFLIEKGIRPSPQRVAVMQYLSTHLTHPTVDEVYSVLRSSMPTLSKTTVYNVVKLLEEKGAINVLTPPDQELHLDATTEQHAHFKCNKCGKIIDIPYSPGQTGIDNQLKQSEALKGCRIANTQLYFSGTCPECLEKSSIEH